MRLGLGALFALGLLGGVASYAASLRSLDDEARAVRLLRWRGSLCTPKIVERPTEAVLRIVCADGKHTFRVQSSHDESIACSLGFDVACWDYAPGG